MAAAVWSCPPNAVKDFPASMLVRFFENHNFLTTTAQHQWKTIPGGCSRYIEPLSAPFKNRTKCSITIRSVARDEQGVTLKFADPSRQDQRFDHAVFDPA